MIANSRRVDRAMRLAQRSLMLGRVDRVTFHEDGVTPESDTDHSIMLALVAADCAPDRLNVGLIMAYAVVHDFVEAYVGDTNTFGITLQQAADKLRREQTAIQQIEDEFPGVVSTMIREYEAQQVAEARWVRVMDKVVVKLSHVLNGCVAIRAMGHTLADLRERHRCQLAELTEQYPDMPEGLDLLRIAMARAEAAWPSDDPKESP